MDEKWKHAINVILRHEGLLSDHPSDPGGVTNYGISLRFLKDTGIDVDEDGDIDRQDVIGLDKESASKIYRTQWWDKYHYGNIEDTRIATKVFDMAVNMGAKQAHKLLQRAMNSLIDKTLLVDGVLGPKTFKCIQDLASIERANLLLNELRYICAQFYKNLVSNKPQFRPFLKGWLNRAAQ